jgi:hypothetical protein
MNPLKKDYKKQESSYSVQNIRATFLSGRIDIGKDDSQNRWLLSA